MTNPTNKLHKGVKALVEDYRNETGDYVSAITVTWSKTEGMQFVGDITTTGGSTSKYKTPDANRQTEET